MITHNAQDPKILNLALALPSMYLSVCVPFNVHVSVCICICTYVCLCLYVHVSVSMYVCAVPYSYKISRLNHKDRRTT